MAAMKRGVLAAALLSALALAGGARAGETFTDRCMALDGDTLMCSQGERIRLHGVGAPEMTVLPWGPLARAALDDVIGVGRVTCTVVDTDSHKRRVAACRAEDGRDLAEAVIRAGLATAHRLYLYPKGPTAEPHAYDRAEAEARADRRGVWGMWVEG